MQRKICNERFWSDSFHVACYILDAIGWQLAVSKLLKLMYNIVMNNYRKSFALTFTIFFVIMIVVVSFMFFSPVIMAY